MTNAYKNGTGLADWDADRQLIEDLKLEIQNLKIEKWVKLEGQVGTFKKLLDLNLCEIELDLLNKNLDGVKVTVGTLRRLQKKMDRTIDEASQAIEKLEKSDVNDH